MKGMLLILVIVFMFLSLLVWSRPVKEQGVMIGERTGQEVLKDKVSEVPSQVILESDISNDVNKGDIPSRSLSDALNDAVRRKDTEGARLIVRKIMEEKRRGSVYDNNMKEELSFSHDD